MGIMAKDVRRLIKLFSSFNFLFQVESEVLMDKLNRTALNVTEESIQIAEQKNVMTITPPQNR